MSFVQELVGILKFRIVQLLALTGLMVAIGTECFITKLSVIDPDVWWHVSVGSWIIQNRSFPSTGIFSRTAGSRPWRAYSWGFELLVSRAYEWFGFLGIGVFGTLLTLGVAVAIFWMLFRLSGRFWAAWLLSIVTYAAFLFNIAPRPLFFSAILFSITLTLLLEAQRTGRVHFLYWLPLVFVFWANSHIQFIYGMSAVALFAGVNLLQRLAIRVGVYPVSLLAPTLPLQPVFVVLGCCVLASCIGPYSFHLYQVVFGYATSKIIYAMLNEMQPLSFKYLNQYVELALAAAAYFMLGWQKKLDPFKSALLILACLFAFHKVRDAWFLCICAGTILAQAIARKDNREPSLSWQEGAGMTVAVALLLFVMARNTDFNTRSLDRTISSEYPVDAVNFLRKHPIGGPLYNSFDWGGFLIFYMPQYPVSIDGRTDLYGDEFNGRYDATQEADPSYVTDPYLNEAGIAILQNRFPISHMLLTDSRFRLVYQDKIATVLARNW